MNNLNEAFVEEINMIKDNMRQNQENEIIATQETLQQTSKKVEVISNINILGYLNIEKINLNLPILQGSDKNTLKKGVGLIEGTGNLGEVGNAALAAHRSYTYGRFFNRLNEVENGDKIIIETKDAYFNYIVFQKIIVDPDDTYILSSDKKNSIITLITCHPLREATHRLIIKAKLENKK